MADQRPNVLFLMSDEHNPRFRGGRDRTDGRGGEPVATPALDDLAAAGTAFTDAYCPMPLCAPSRQCMLTGKEQHHAGAWGNASVLTGEQTTLPEVFSTAGYETCLVGKMHFNGTRQFNGYDYRPYGDLTGHGIQQPGHQPDPVHYDDLDVQPRRQAIDIGTRIPGAGVTQIPESLLQEQVVARETVSWLREHRARSDDPWFLTASFSRPHFPLTAPRRHVEQYPPGDVPEPPVGDEGDPADHPHVESRRERYRLEEFDDEQLRQARAAYFACVSFLDEVLGELLGTLEAEGFLEETIVVYVSDHGDMAGEHGLWWKGTFFEGSAGIPMLIQTPAQRRGDAPGRRVETPVNLVDTFPTLCGLTGVDAPGDLDGVDLAESVRTGTEPDRGPVFTDSLGGGDHSFRMVRDGRWKYVGFRDAPELFFDLETDPHETRNLAPDAEGAAAEALDRLRGLVGDTVDFQAAVRQREAASEAAADYELGIPPGTGNAYVMPDGRLIDAASPLYRPDELADDVSLVFEDWPGGER